MTDGFVGNNKLSLLANSFQSVHSFLVDIYTSFILNYAKKLLMIVPSSKVSSPNSNSLV